MQLEKYNLQMKFAAPLRRQLSASWAWWIGELRSMLPPRLRRLLMPRTQRLFLELENGDIVLKQGAAQHKEVITRYALDEPDSASLQLAAEQQTQQQARQLVLCLPADQVLSRTLTLPLAAEENLREVLSFEMDRQTPFTAEQVYYDYSIVSRSATERTLTVDLVLTMRRTLDELLTQLDRRGLHPDQVTSSCDERGGFAAVNLLPMGKRQRKAVTPQLVNLALAVLALALLVTALSLPLLEKRQKIRALEPLLETASAKAEEARRLRKEVDQLKANSRFLIDKKQSSLPVLQVLDELTRILPDDTWITRLDIKGSELEIQGQSASAAALIPLIESSSILQNPRFRSPVTQIPRSDVERFHLSAETRGPTP
jgi:general secretion pathway protein L